MARRGRSFNREVLVNTDRCDFCGKILYIGSFPFCPHESVHGQYAIQGDPTIVYRSPEGKYFFPGDAKGAGAARYDKLGYKRIELDTMQKRNKFNKEYGERATAEVREHWYKEHQGWEATQSHYADGLRSLRDMSPQGRQFYDQCMKDAEKRRRSAPPSDAGFYIEISQ